MYRPPCTSSPGSPIIRCRYPSRDCWGQFQQRVYVLLWCLQFPKAQKSCLSWLSFCAFGIWVRRSCAKNVGEIVFFWSCDCRTNRLIRRTFFKLNFGCHTRFNMISIQNLNSEKNGFGNTTPMYFEAIGYWAILIKHLNGICWMPKKLSCNDALLRNRLEPRKMKRSCNSKKRREKRSDKLIKDDHLIKSGSYWTKSRRVKKKRKTYSSIDLNVYIAAKLRYDKQNLFVVPGFRYNREVIWLSDQ